MNDTTLTTIDCPDCQDGRVEYSTTDVRDVRDPLRTVEGKCSRPGCVGGEVEIESCKSCGAQIDDCVEEAEEKAA